MSSDNSFLIEFPADKDCVPIVQDFFRDYLRSFDYSKKFSEYVANESGAWFRSIMPKVEFLHALPTVSFSGKCSKLTVQVHIKAADDKEFSTTIDAQKAEAE
ncbi:MAG: hypothetical protein LBC85_06805 [Fibromonadaceae bacterium]|jgi:hypothetical protein|nr:hypothetical protein [Fibromonadaceae bacterium]